MDNYTLVQEFFHYLGRVFGRQSTTTHSSKETMKPLFVLTQIYKVGGLCCLSRTCPHTKECASHSSAGDFRAEEGSTPLLNLGRLKPSDGFILLKCYGPSDEMGALVYKNNEWIPYDPFDY